MTKIFDMCPGWLWATLLGLALLTSVALKLNLDHTKVLLAQQVVKTAEMKSAYDAKALEASEANRKIEQLRQKASEEINEVVDQERSRTAAAVRDGNDARSMLLDATRRFAARSGSASDPGALARAEDRAATLGGLLGTCDQVAADLGHDAEDLATQVRGLQRSYTSLTVPLGLRLPRSPLANGGQADPGVPTLRHVEVDAAHPVLALDPGLHGGLGLLRE